MDQDVLAQLAQLVGNRLRLVRREQAERGLEQFDTLLDVLKRLRPGAHASFGRDSVGGALEALSRASSTKPMRRGSSFSSRFGMATSSTLSWETFWMSFMRRPASSSPSNVTMSGFQ